MGAKSLEGKRGKKEVIVRVLRLELDGSLMIL